MKNRRKDWLIPWYFVMAFAVVFLVNGIFVYVAIKSHSGVVTENAYEKGLEYDKTIAMAQEQEKLGWNGEIAYKDNWLSLSLTNNQGLPVKGATVMAYLKQPIRQGNEGELLLQESEAGMYKKHVIFPQKGQWNIIVNVLWNKKQYQKKKRLLVN